MAVVDQRLRVHGIQNLWVGDASIMPVVSRANTNLTSIMIGERLADFVQEIAKEFKFKVQVQGSESDGRRLFGSGT